MTALGIVAIITCVLGIITPTAGIILSGLSGIFAIFSLKCKDPLAQAALILNLFNLSIFSPYTVMAIFSKDTLPFWRVTPSMKLVYWIITCIQLVGILLWYLYSKDHENQGERPSDKLKQRIEPRL